MWQNNLGGGGHDYRPFRNLANVENFTHFYSASKKMNLCDRFHSISDKDEYLCQKRIKFEIKKW